MQLRVTRVSFISLFIATFFLLPAPVLAVGAAIGEHCSIDADCATGECEDSNLDIADDDFCVCEEGDGGPEQCAALYNTQNGEVWTCENGDDASANVNYCSSNQRGRKTVITVNKKQIGAVCEDNDECLSGDCESSDQKTSFCVCAADKNCGETYGTQNGETWICEDGTDASQDLHYCASNQRGNQIIDIQASIAAANAGNTAFNENTKPFELVKPTLQISLPDLEFEDASEAVDEQGNTAFTVNWIAQYFKAIYLYLLGLVGLIAVIVFIHAGLEYMTSGGNTAGIKAAKERMLNAVIGIFVLFGGYTVLHAINPALTRFQGIQISALKRVPMDLKAMEEFASPEDIDVEAPTTIGLNGIPTFKQGGQPWGRIPYGATGKICADPSKNNPPECNSTFGYAACGVTSLAMVLKHFGEPVDPRVTAAYAIEVGARGKSGTSVEFVTKIKQKWPKYTGKAVSNKQALELLKRKIPIIASTPKVGSCYKQGGHWIVLTGVDESGNIGVNDPGGGKKCLIPNKAALRTEGFFVEEGFALYAMTQENFNKIPFFGVVAPTEILQEAVAQPVS
ncbi:MAG: C39 family peptidase [Candidatus Magasanikbacteria bacterium]|nr:C39 family peptidase [Candidatus Magasanikbacteria bacterium]